MKRKFRIWAIRQGLIKPKDHKEKMEAYVFPVKLIQQKPKSLFYSLNVRRVL
jgi:hypothetical protein